MPKIEIDRATRQERARAARYGLGFKLRLQAILGPRCRGCNKVGETEPDHIIPRTLKVENLSRRARFYHYIEELIRGNIQPLCRSCNARKRHATGYTPDIPPQTTPEAPF